MDVDLGKIYSVLGAGALIGDPQPVTGGLLHRLWRVETQTGAWAVKVLNPEIMSRPEAKQNYRLSENVARAAYHGGIPAIIAKAYGNEPWTESDGSYIMVFDWVEGRTLLPGECGTEHASILGGWLGRIHGLDLEVPGMVPPAWSSIPEDRWQSLVERAYLLFVDRESNSRDHLLRDVCEWSGQAHKASVSLSQHKVVSHRDLDPKNVIWTNAQGPSIIDWESAGYVHPTLELVEVALNWSRKFDGTSDKTRFQAAIQGYLDAGGRLHGHISDALYGTMAGTLDWLEYNLRRTVDVETFGHEERELGLREVKQTVAQLRQLADQVEEYVRWCEEIKG